MDSDTEDDCLPVKRKHRPSRECCELLNWLVSNAIGKKKRIAEHAVSLYKAGEGLCDIFLRIKTLNDV